jgi:hypothetical protein
MEQEMLEMFIYYNIVMTDQYSKERSIDGIIENMEYALYLITENSFDAWNEWLNKFPETHPVYINHKKLMNLTQEQYVDTIVKLKKMAKKFGKIGTLNYDSMDGLASEKDVEKLAYQIILKSIPIKEVENELEKVMAELDEKKDEIEKEEEEKGVERLVVLAEDLGLRYYYGIDTEIDYEATVNWLSGIVDYSAEAKYLLATCYKKGNGVKEDKEKAYNLFCEIPNDVSLYEKAKMEFYGEGTKQDYEKAFKDFCKLKDNVPYDLNFIIDSYLGEMYFYGLGVEKDKEKGFKLLENGWNSKFVRLDYKKIKDVLKEYYNIKE